MVSEQKFMARIRDSFFLILFLSPCPDQMVDRRREMMSAALIISDEPQRHIPSEDLD